MIKKRKWIKRVSSWLLLSPLFSCSLLLDYGDAPESPSVDLPGYELVWRDEFDGTDLNLSKWTVQVGKNESAVNSASAVNVANGLLSITTYTENKTHFSGFVESLDDRVFGFIEARIRFQPSPGEVGTFWLQSHQNGDPLGDPAAAGAEIDIVQYRAVDQDDHDVSAMYSMGVQWNGYGDGKKVVYPPFFLTAPESLSGTWHTWAVLWTKIGYEFYMDGDKYWMTSEGLSKHGEHLRFSCVVSDGDWAGSIPSGGYGSLATSTTKMEVDWVRVWQKP